MITLGAPTTISEAATPWYGTSSFTIAFNVTVFSRLMSSLGTIFGRLMGGGARDEDVRAMTDESGRLLATPAEETMHALEVMDMLVVVSGKELLAMWLVVILGEVTIAEEWELHATPALQMTEHSGYFNN
jgi:hypothetical protein